RTLASEMDLGYDEAEALKVNINHEKIKPDIRTAAEAAIDRTLEVWLDGVELALSEFDSVDHLPNRILLCGGGASLEKLVDALSSQDWYKGLPFTKRPTVQHIKPSDVIGISDVTEKASDHTYITAMGLLRVGYDTISGTDDTDSVKEKVNKL